MLPRLKGVSILLGAGLATALVEARLVTGADDQNDLAMCFGGGVKTVLVELRALELRALDESELPEDRRNAALAASYGDRG